MLAEFSAREAEVQSTAQAVEKGKSEIPEEDMQGMGSWVRHGGDTGMLDPMKNDPWLEVEEREMGQLEAISESDFFRLTNSINKEQLEYQKQLIDAGLEMLSKLSDLQYLAAEEALEADQEWTLHMLAMAPDPKEMIGGSMSTSAAAMEYLLQQTSSQSKQARKVLEWLRTGMKFEFVGTDHASQEKAPHRKRTLEVVRKMLQRVVGKDRVEEYLSSKSPLKVQFPNHKSVSQYTDFVEEELEKARAKGVITDWPFEEPSRVINGLKVVEN